MEDKLIEKVEAVKRRFKIRSLGEAVRFVLRASLYGGSPVPKDDVRASQLFELHCDIARENTPPLDVMVKSRWFDSDDPCEFDLEEPVEFEPDE